MAGQLNNSVFDGGLDVLTNDGDEIHILSADPGVATFANIATYTLGNKTAPTVGAAADRSGGGREVVVTAITDGSVTGTGTATHWALIDQVSDVILAVNALSASQAVTSGNTFTLAEFAIGIPDPA